MHLRPISKITWKFDPRQHKLKIVILTLLLVSAFLYYEISGPERKALPEQFVVATGMSRKDVVDKLMSSGFIRSPALFRALLSFRHAGDDIKPGGYTISKSMNIFELAGFISGRPQSIWITIPEGLRKEQIAELIADKLGWDDTGLTKFNSAYKLFGSDYIEGVYFPDTYLISITDGGEAVAKRLISRFNERISEILPGLNSQNIKWTTAVKLASIIQREAAGKADMPIISGILWNRLEDGMRIEIDTTIQYALGEPGNWWPRLDGQSTYLESPYNTYRNSGLPPTPISNPGLDALIAVIRPEKTDCYFYIHDNSREIRCAETFAEHKRNIAIYLK